MERIKTSNVHFPKEEWASVSDEIKSLITTMLIKNPDERPNAKELLKHPWFKKKEEGVSKIKYNVIESLKKF